jgi:hypothetical protein
MATHCNICNQTFANPSSLKRHITKSEKHKKNAAVEQVKKNKAIFKQAAHDAAQVSKAKTQRAEEEPYDLVETLTKELEKRDKFENERNNGLLKMIKIDETNHELLANSAEESKYEYKTLTEEDKAMIAIGEGWHSIEFQYFEERKSNKNGGQVRVFEGTGHGWAYCGKETVEYLYSIHLNYQIHPDYFISAAPEFEHQITEFGTVHYDRYMKITSITRHEEKPNVSIKKVPLRASGSEKQITLGSYGGKYCSYEDIPYYRKNSCMTSFFMGQFKGNYPGKKKDEEMSHEFLYKLATGEDLEENEDAGVSLEQATKWCDYYGISMLAIDFRGKSIFEYKPKSVNKKIKGGHCWRILVDQGHVWAISNEFKKEVDQLQLSAEKLEEYNNTPTIEDKPNKPVPWIPLKKPSENPPEFVFTVEQIEAKVLENKKESKFFYISNNLDELAAACIDKGYLPGCIRTGKMTAIEGFDIRMVVEKKTKTVRINKAMNDALTGDQYCEQAFTSHQQHTVNTFMYKLREAFLPKHMSSVLSEDLEKLLEAYPRTAIYGKKDDTVKEDLVEYDQTRAYTACIMETTHVPKHTPFDRLTLLLPKKYLDVEDNLEILELINHPPDQSEIEIDEHSSYYVYCPQLDYLLFNQDRDFVPGFVLIYARSQDIPFIMIGKITPVMVQKVDPKTVIQEIYDNESLTPGQKKDIANVTYGIAMKKYQRLDTAELHEKDQKFNKGFMRQFNEEYNLLVHKKKVKLTESYRPVGFIILNKSRINLHKKFNKITPYIKAINVDAVLIDEKDQEICDKILEKEGVLNHKKKGIESFGCLKPPAKKTKVFKKHFTPEKKEHSIPWFYFPTEPIVLKDEEKTMDTNAPDRWDEVDKTLGAKNWKNQPYSMHIDALVPGAGKTYMIEQYAKRHNKKILFITPWNALASDIRKRLFTAITLHNLCGKLVQYETVDELMKKKKFNTEEYDITHFDEICLYSPTELNWIHEFVKYDKKENQKMTSTGDSNQLGCINTGEFHTNRHKWYKMVLDTLFHETIQLQISKRLTNKEDRQTMYNMCNDLLHESKTISRILEEAKLPTMHFDELTKEDFQYPHITALQNTSSKIDNLAGRLLNKPNDGKYIKGEELVGVKSYACKGGKRISSSDSYIVEKVDKEEVTLMGSDGVERVLSISQAMNVLRRAFSRTCHSTQGMSLGDKIYIHDIGTAMADHCWVRTAITRCSTLNIVIVKGSQMKIPKRTDIEAKIRGHKAADIEKDRKYEEDQYVTVEWFNERMKKQRFQCSFCHKPLDTEYSIDRINNDKPHTKQNCVISCPKCQCKSSQR